MCSPLQSHGAYSPEFRSQKETAGIVVCGSKDSFFLLQDKVSLLCKTTIYFRVTQPVKHNRKQESSEHCSAIIMQVDMTCDKPDWRRLNLLAPCLKIFRVVHLSAAVKGFIFQNNFISSSFLFGYCSPAYFQHGTYLWQHTATDCQS